MTTRQESKVLVSTEAPHAYPALKDTREKRKDLTQSYEKAPTPAEMSNDKVTSETMPQKVRLQSGCGPTSDGQLE